MTSEQFCNWLAGYFDLAAPREIRESEILVIKDHLKLVKNPIIGVTVNYPKPSKEWLKASEDSFNKMMREINDKLREEGKAQIYC